MLRQNTQPQMIQVDGHTCFKVDNSDELLCLTEDDLNTPQLVTDAQTTNDRDTINQIVHAAVQDEMLGATFVPKSAEGDGCCGAAIPYVPYQIGVLVLCLDIFLPGIGTLVSAYYDPSGCNCKTITCGIF